MNIAAPPTAKHITMHMLLLTLDNACNNPWKILSVRSDVDRVGPSSQPKKMTMAVGYWRVSA